MRNITKGEQSTNRERLSLKTANRSASVEKKDKSRRPQKQTSANEPERVKTSNQSPQQAKRTVLNVPDPEKIDWSRFTNGPDQTVAESYSEK